MNKLMLVSLAVLLGGATVAPLHAEDGRRAGGERSWQDAGDKGHEPERAQNEREARRDDREDRRGNGEDRRDYRADLRGDNRSGVRTWTPGNSDHRLQASRTFAGRVAAAQYSAQHRDGDRDHDGDRDWNRDRDDRHDDDRAHREHDRQHYRDWRNEWREDRHDWRSDHRRDSRHYTRYRDSRWSGYHWSPQYRYRTSVRYVYPYGYRPYRWTVGYRMPYHYYSPRNYWVDYRMYRLPPAPYGYQWVRVDRDVVLVELASGLIRDVLYGIFY